MESACFSLREVIPLSRSPGLQQESESRSCARLKMLGSAQALEESPNATLKEKTNLWVEHNPHATLKQNVTRPRQSSYHKRAYVKEPKPP